MKGGTIFSWKRIGVFLVVSLIGSFSTGLMNQGLVFGYGGGGGGGSLPFTSEEYVSVTINGGAAETSSSEVVLNLSGGSSAALMRISNDPDTLSDAVAEPYQPTRNWTLLNGLGQRTVYVKFYNATGGASTPVSDTIYVVSPAGSGDLDGNGIVDLLDVNLFMVQWGMSGPGIPSDLNHDGMVDLLDFNLLMIAWS
jgi:hypothetical protein